MLMNKLTKAQDLKYISLAKIKSSTTNNCKELINAISVAVNKKLASNCSVVSIQHSVEVKAIIKNKTAKVQIENKEEPGSNLIKTNEPKELHYFSYENLKKAAKLNNGVYRGKLYATIETNTCNPKIDCPDCNGLGICSHCDGNKQVTCIICDGKTECISCEGTGRYTCKNCRGEGSCPKCDHGWVTCNECEGDGTDTCEDCGGSGNYIDSFCNHCDGSGEYRPGVTCHTCNGTGRYVVECRKCHGEGTVDCDNCDGEGGWNCNKCNGSGKCSNCKGDGTVTCKACKGSGTCGKCRGKGKIWCPECHGKGICFNCKGDKLIICPRCNGLGNFQSFTEYSFTEKENEKQLFSFPIPQIYYSQVYGNLCYDGIIYDFFAKKTSVLNNVAAENSLNGIHSKTLKKWLSLDSISIFGNVNITDDYLNTYVEIYNIPVTKVVIKQKSTTYPIWIIGEKLLVFYENLPRLGFWGIFLD